MTSGTSPATSEVFLLCLLQRRGGPAHMTEQGAPQRQRARAVTRRSTTLAPKPAKTSSKREVELVTGLLHTQPFVSAVQATCSGRQLCACTGLILPLLCALCCCWNCGTPRFARLAWLSAHLQAAQTGTVASLDTHMPLCPGLPGNAGADAAVFLNLFVCCQRIQTAVLGEGHPLHLVAQSTALWGETVNI